MTEPTPQGVTGGFATQPIAVKDEDVAAARTVIHDRLVDAQKASVASGKPVAILVGEYHYSTKSAALEAIIYDESRKVNNVRDVAIEYSSRPQNDEERGMIAQLTQNPDNHIVHEGERIRHVGGGMALTYQQAIYRGDTPHLVDDNHHLATGNYAPNDPLALVPRDAAMADNISAIPRSVMDVVGVDHLHGIAANLKAKDTHEIVVFDVAGPELQTRNTTPPAGTTTLTLSGDMGSLNSDRIRRLSMGTKEALQYNNAQYEQDTPAPVAKPAAPSHPFAAMLDTPEASHACSTLKTSCAASAEPQPNAGAAEVNATRTPAAPAASPQQQTVGR